MQQVSAQGFDVPAIGYGTWQLRGKECREGVAHALSVGYRHVDTAQMYGNEDEVGQAVEGSAVARSEVWLTTKLGLGNMAADAVKRSTEESLSKLRTDYLDLLLIHWPSQDTPLAETLGAMHELRKAGKVRTVGVSNFPPSWQEAALRHGPLLTNQVEYHLYLPQRPVLDLCADHDMVLTAYSPLAHGRVLDDPVVREIAESHKVHPAQVAIAWVLSQGPVTAIPKATAPERIESNLAALEVSLSPDERARLDELGEGATGRIIDPPFAPDWER